MRRDMNVLRQILLAVRDADGVVREVPGIDQAVYLEHARLLDEAGLVTASIHQVQQRVDVALIWRLTWAGHDFADAIQQDTLWHKAQSTVLKPAASWTFDVLKEWLKTEISQGLPTLRGAGQ